MQTDDQTDAQLPFRRIVWSLAVAETVVWAAYYYSFPALILIWEKDLGWSKTELSGAFTLALVMSAAVAPLVGRLIDRGYAEQVFAGGAALAAVFLLALSAVTALWQFYLVWFGLGLVMAATLYEACFTVLTLALREQAKRGITAVALVAGFAGTVSFPSAHFLSAWFGWRVAVVVFAGAVAIIALPLIVMACRSARAGLQPTEQARSMTLGDAMGVMRRPAFWGLLTLFAAIALNHGMLITHLLPILDDRGISQGLAILAAAMIGPMQVFGRLLMIAFGGRASTFSVFVVCLLATAVGAFVLMQVGVSTALLMAFVVLQGAGYGVTSIVRPVFVAERLGRQHFGTVTGMLAIAFVGGSAASPTIAALIWELGGYEPVIWCAFAMSILGLGALMLIPSGTAGEKPS